MELLVTLVNTGNGAYGYDNYLLLVLATIDITIDGFHHPGHVEPWSVIITYGVVVDTCFTPLRTGVWHISTRGHGGRCGTSTRRSSSSSGAGSCARRRC